MTSPIKWFELVAAVAAREVRQLISRPQEIIFCGFMPVIWVLIVWGLLYNGVITDVPVAYVDHDNTSMSREIGRALDADRTMGLVTYNSHDEALAALKHGSVYGIIEVPEGYMKEQYKGTGSSLSVYLDENRYAVAGTIQTAVTTIMSAMTLQNMAKVTLLTGSGVSGAERIISGVHSDFYALGNMQFSFLAFLGSNLMPGVIMLAAVLSFVTAIVREVYLYRINEWMDTAKHHVTAALCGKLLPHYFFYCLVILAYIGLFAGISGFTALKASSLFIWFICGAACLLVMLTCAILICAISPTWRFSLVVASGFAAPALPFTGFSMPLDSMSDIARTFSKCLPLTWFIEGQTQQWTLGADIWDMGTTFGVFLLMIFIPLILGIPVFRWKYRKFAKRELEAEADHVC